MGFLRNHNKGYKWLQNKDKIYIDRFGTFLVVYYYNKIQQL